MRRYEHAHRGLTVAVMKQPAERSEDRLRIGCAADERGAGDDMDDGEPTNDASAEEPAYRYHRWHNTVIRERELLDAEYLGPDGWDSSPYAIDALTGMGEDMYSCGESSDPITETEATRIAEAKGLSLDAGRAPREPSPTTVSRRTARRPLVSRILRRR